MPDATRLESPSAATLVAREGPGSVRVLAILLWGALFGLPALGQDQLTVAFSEVVISADQKITFSGGAARRGPWRQEIEEIPIAWVQTGDGAFRVGVDLSETRLDRFEKFVSYRIVVLPANDPEAAYQAIVRADTIGKIVDHEVDVDFEVGRETDAGPQRSLGRLRLPIYARSGSSLLVAGVETEPVELNLKRGGDISVQLRNLSPDLPVEVLEEGLTAEPDDRAYWAADARVEVRLRRSPEGSWLLDPGVATRDGLRLILRPDPWRAIRATLWRPRKSSAEEVQTGERDAEVHERLTLRIPHRSLGGRLQLEEIEIPIRFVPSVPALAVSGFVGCLLGTLLPWSQRRTSWRAWLASVGTGVVGLVAAWLVAILLVRANCAVRFFGVDLDPYGIVEIAVLGLVVGANGFRSLDWMKGRFGSGPAAMAATPGSPKPPTPADGGDEPGSGEETE